MKKVLSLVLSLVMLLSMVVPVSAEDTYPGNGTLKDKTAAFTIEADKTTLYGEGEQIVRFHIYVESKDSVPIRAFQFTLVPSEGLTLADKEMAKDGAFYYALQNNLSTNGNVHGMYSLLAYTPGSRYFGAAGTDEGKGITTKTEIMTIMGKVNGLGEYTLSMTGVVAGNGDAPDKVTQKFTSTVAGATVTVKTESERPQPNLSLALSKSNVKVGDTFTATLSNKGMTVSSFIAKLEFDKKMLAVTKIEQLGGFAGLAAGATIDPVLSTPDEANDRSLVGVGFVRGSDKTHEAGEFLRVTFQAKAAGNTAISLHEDSDGTNGYRGDAKSGTVTVEAAAVTGVTVTAYPESLASSYSVNGQTVTVTYDKPCKVGYLGSDGKYVAISAVASGSSYAFTAPDGVTEVVLVIKGDVDKNDSVGSSDKSVLARSLLPSTHKFYKELGVVESFALDLDDNGVIGSSDKSLLARSMLPSTHRFYKALTW